MLIRAVLVEDEPVELEFLRHSLAPHRGVDVVAACTDGCEAVDTIRALRPDVVFLDVQLPGFDGFRVLRELAGDAAPEVVFVTAYEEYALNAFDADAIDYLLKPFDHERVEDCVNRLRRRFGQAARTGAQRLAARCGKVRVLLETDSICWLEAASNYVWAHCPKDRFLVRSTLGALMSRLDARAFVRIHRSAVVNMRFVAGVVPTGSGDHLVQLKDGTELRLSRRYRTLFEQEFGDIQHKKILSRARERRDYAPAGHHKRKAGQRC